jgi:hypothetical protein
MSRLSVVMTMRLAAIDLFLLWYGALVRAFRFTCKGEYVFRECLWVAVVDVTEGGNCCGFPEKKRRLFSYSLL